jgi:predicted PurR-regulated permease PerM
VLGLAGEAASAALTAFTVLFLALFFVIDMPKLQGMLSSVLMPNAAERAVATWERITDAVSRWAVGAAIVAVVAGTVQGTTAWLLGSSFALALGIVAGFLDLIPTIGATIAGFILVPTLLAEEGLTAAVVMLVVIVVYQQVENNLITPKVQSKAVEISAFFVILSVTLFGALLGVLGALVAVPVTAAIQIILREITAERRAQVEAARLAAAAPDSSP